MQARRSPRAGSVSTRHFLVLSIILPVVLAGCFDRSNFGCNGTSTVDSGQPDDSSDNGPPDGAVDPDGNGNPPADQPCVACHNLAMGNRRQIVGDTTAGVHVLLDGPLTNSDCVLCHEITQHTQGKVRLWAEPNTHESVIVVEDDPSRNSVEGDKLVGFCHTCHNAAHNGVHGVPGNWQPACVACHDVHHPGSANLSLVRTSIFNVSLTTDIPVVFTATNGLGSYNDGVGANDGVCQVCHTATLHHKNDGGGTAHNVGVDCTGCHPHNKGFIPNANAGSCVDCHSAQQGARPAVVNADGSGGHHLSTAVLSPADCVKCHDQSQHQKGTVRLWTNPNNHTTSLAVGADSAPLVPFCTTCHGGVAGLTIHTTGGSWEPACTECHAIHERSNTNLSLVGSPIFNKTLGVNKPVVFTATSGPGSFSDGMGANDGVCQVCHTATLHHKNDGGGTVHNEGADCTACHQHDAGFIQDGNGSCIACHATAQGARRAVLGEFSLASHHVQAAGVTDADCTVCHDMSKHQQGQVRLKNADDPANAGAAIVLTGNPLSSLTEASKLEPFCLSCHDSNGANGSAPFGGGRMPTAIDSTLWTPSAHRVGQTTCVGDGETFGCHSTGHGSAKTLLLAPWQATQSAIVGDPLRQGEGFCFSCHDANGPAATNVEATFALATHHKVSAADQVDGSRVECVNCHNPHTVSANAVLTNPDSGIPWTGSGEGFCLTCHDGTPPPGVSFPATSAGTGFNKSVFVGTTHNTELGPDSCRHCHESHGSANLAMLQGKYVVNDRNSYSAGDGDYAACWLCHIENQVINQQNGFEELHKKHVREEKAPCIICHDAHAPFDAGEAGLINLAYSVQLGYDIGFSGGSDGSTSFRIEIAQDRGSCTITCHGENHSPKSYDRMNVQTTDCIACHANRPG